LHLDQKSLANAAGEVLGDYQKRMFSTKEYCMIHNMRVSV
jgi:hypothetical protein